MFAVLKEKCYVRAVCCHKNHLFVVTKICFKTKMDLRRPMYTVDICENALLRNRELYFGCISLFKSSYIRFAAD